MRNCKVVARCMNISPPVIVKAGGLASMKKKPAERKERDEALNNGKEIQVVEGKEADSLQMRSSFTIDLS